MGGAGGKSLLLIGSTPPLAGASRIVEQVLQHWPKTDRPPLEYRSVEHILEDPALLDAYGMAWLLPSADQMDRLYELAGLVQDHRLPAMLTRAGDETPIGAPFLNGVVAGPPDSPAATLAAVLRTLWCQAEVVGVLTTELSLLRLQHGGVLDQFDKLDEELRVAAQVQREFMPTELPHLRGIEFEVLYRPTGYVSGDIYDVSWLDDTHVGFFLADAVGHGVPAALMTAHIKSSLIVRQYDGRDPQGHGIIAPDETLCRLNQDIIDHQTGQVMTATAVYGVINTQTWQLQIARAGHPHPLVYRADGSTRRLGPDGALLGIFPDERFELMQFQLEPGDRLVLFSDGFELAFPNPGSDQVGGAISSHRYLNEFKDLAKGPLDRAIDRLGKKLDRQIGSLNQLDDLTVLLVSVTGVPVDKRVGESTVK